MPVENSQLFQPQTAVSAAVPQYSRAYYTRGYMIVAAAMRYLSAAVKNPLKSGWTPQSDLNAELRLTCNKITNNDAYRDLNTTNSTN